MNVNSIVPLLIRELGHVSSLTQVVSRPEESGKLYPASQIPLETLQFTWPKISSIMSERFSEARNTSVTAMWSFPQIGQRSPKFFRNWIGLKMMCARDFPKISDDMLDSEYPAAVGPMKFRTGQLLLHLCAHAGFHPDKPVICAAP